MQWWERTSCPKVPLVDEFWEGSLGVGAGENGIIDQDENHAYSNQFI